MDPDEGEAPVELRRELDPVRRVVMERAREKHLTMADLSRAMGKNESYMHQFVHRGTPKRLPEEGRLVLATLLDVPETALRPDGAAPAMPLPLLPSGRPAAAPSRFATPAAQPALPAARDVPIYQDSGPIDATAAEEWTWRPPRLVTAGGAFALWISRPRGRLRPGDLAYVRTTQPPRVGDTVVAVKGTEIAAIGDLTTLDDARVEIRDGGDAQSFQRTDVRLMKIVGVDFA